MTFKSCTRYSRWHDMLLTMVMALRHATFENLNCGGRLRKKITCNHNDDNDDDDGGDGDNNSGQPYQEVSMYLTKVDVGDVWQRVKCQTSSFDSKIKHYPCSATTYYKSFFRRLEYDIEINGLRSAMPPLGLLGGSVFVYLKAALAPSQVFCIKQKSFLSATCSSTSSSTSSSSSSSSSSSCNSNSSRRNNNGHTYRIRLCIIVGEVFHISGSVLLCEKHCHDMQTPFRDEMSQTPKCCHKNA
uniref:Uncharacterized protein n=1 Tax=Glossina austeni TaxID=7395 RepID=A0A1A9USL8_GLOAU